MAPPTSSNRSVRITDAVSIYEPDTHTPKPIYSMSTGSTGSCSSMMKGSNNSFVRSRNHVVGGNRKPAQSHNHHNNTVQRQNFFLNKFFRTGTSTTPYNSFRHSNSHDERSDNDESTNASGNGGSIQLLITPAQEFGMIDTETANSTDSDNVNSSNVTTTTMMIQHLNDPLGTAADSQPQRNQHQQPERRKFFMDKLFTVSRMHVTEAGHQPVNNNVDNNTNGSIARNGRRTTTKGKDESPRKIIYSVDGDTATTNSSVGVDEDINDLSSTSTPGIYPKVHHPSFVAVGTHLAPPPPPPPLPHDTNAAVTACENESPTTTILMEFPMEENHEVMEIQTDRLPDTPKRQETVRRTPPSMRISNSSHSPSPMLHENFAFKSPPEIDRSTIQPINTLIKDVELPPPLESLPAPIKKVKEPTSPNLSSDVNFNSTNNRRDTIPKSVTSSSRRSEKRHEWKHQYFGNLLDKVTKIQCITNCSDIDLARCDDVVEDYIASPLNIVAKRWSGGKEEKRRRYVTTRRVSTTNSIVKVDDQSSSNSMYTDDYDDDVETFDDSVISASLFDTDTLDDENTYTTFENDDDHHYSSNNRHNTAIPVRLQKLLGSDATGTTSKYMGDDDNTSAYSSQNSAWL